MKEGVAHIIHYNARPVASIKKAWNTMLKNAGITRRIRPHDLRHAFATVADIGTVGNLMGNSSPMMILKQYQCVMDRQKRAVVESLPELPHVPKNKKGYGN